MNTTQTQNRFKSFSNLVLALLCSGVLTACARNGTLDPNATDPNATSGSGNNNNGSSTTPPSTTGNGPFTGSYKPEALTWESSSHPERGQWSKSLYAIVGEYFQSLNMASDIDTFCPNYDSLTRDERINLWADVIAGTSYYESSYNPKDASVDVGNQSNKDTWSVGLMQMSVVDQANYGFKFGYTFTDLQDPIKNLRLATAIMAKQVSKYGILLIPVGGKGLYWATLHPGGKYDKTASVAKMTKKLSFCQ